MRLSLYELLDVEFDEVLDDVLEVALVEVLDEVLLEAELVELLDVVVVFTVPLPAAPAQALVGVRRQAATRLALRSFVKFMCRQAPSGCDLLD
ncbi:MAG: hypothetical protein EB084_13830 [Proteobacteria bacterium]|nr:hypothetical protein [Pseudomonadota bacterium]